jgi:hypothetical protein
MVQIMLRMSAFECNAEFLARINEEYVVPK